MHMSALQTTQLNYHSVYRYLSDCSVSGRSGQRSLVCAARLVKGAITASVELAKSSANGLVCTGFASGDRFQPERVLKAQ